MKVLDFGRYALCSSIALAMVAGCSVRQDQPFDSAQGGTLPRIGANLLHPNVKYAVLYSFRGAPDGANPAATLIALNGKLYGTTTAGGSGASGGYGTVFEVSTSGKKSVLYRFKGGTDGAFPQATLVALSGMLYGTTLGSDVPTDYGTVFAVDPSSGKERVLYNFKGGKDGANPIGGVIAFNGTLYGTTINGGVANCSHGNYVGCGTVFAVSTAGVETLLYRFKGGKDGAQPEAAILAPPGTGIFMGTTAYGGTGTCTGGIATGCGTIFKVTPSGSGYIEKVLYSFKSGADGAEPLASLVLVNSSFYGTTFSGGTDNSGTIFQVHLYARSPDLATESVLYSFTGGADGAGPIAGLTAVNDELFGTAANAGAPGCSGGCGTVFKASTSGAEHTLHKFTGGTDAATPLAGLATITGTLYGTTYAGGGTGCGGGGCGTIYKLTP